MKKSKLTSTGAKKKLITYHNFRESDFYENTLICKDYVGISAKDAYEEIQLKFKEEAECHN